MSTTKVSALANKGSLTGNEEILINDGGTSKKSSVTAVRAGVTDATKLPLAGGTMTGNIVMSGSETVDGRDVSADGAQLDTNTSAIATKAPIASPTFTGTVAIPNISDLESAVTANTAKTSNATHTGEVTGATALTIADNVVDEANLKVSNTPTNGYFLSAQSGNTGGLTWAEVSTTIADGSISTAKIADDAVTAAKLANSINTDIATGVTANTTANAALPKTGGAMTGAITTNSTFDGRDVATDGAKLDGIEANADVTDATNVAAAGALMDSEVTNLAQVKAFNSSDYATAAQGTTANAALPKAGGAMTGNVTHADNVKAQFGASNDLEIYHDGGDTYIKESGTGALYIASNEIKLVNAATSEAVLVGVEDGTVRIYYDNVKKFETTANGVTVTGTAIATTNTDATNTGTVTLDFAANQNFVLTLTGAVTLANPSTEQVGQSGFITFIQDGTGGRTVSLGTDYETAGGAGLTLTSTASATDIVPYVVVASGRILLGTPQLAFA